MSNIHILDDHLISQIAAGEVVERPASVVKELVENSLDAGGSSIRIELEAGGKRSIVVADDGEGMDSDDALLAFDRHATSKIASFADLERVASLGFRGEALASVAAVARVELKTATARRDDGCRVRIEGGRVRSVTPIPFPKGTKIEVRSLFFNVPARRKFLKKTPTELRRSVEVVQGYALARPATRFSLRHGDRELIDATATSDDLDGFKERVAQLFGRSFGDSLIEFDPYQGLVRGLVGRPETAGARRTFIFVNRRLVRDRLLLSRFYRAVRDEWKSDELPSLFLFLEVPPEEIDVNVHPQKTEVRFRSYAMVDRVDDALRQALASARGHVSAPITIPFRPPAPVAWEGLGSRYREQRPVSSSEFGVFEEVRESRSDPTDRPGQYSRNDQSVHHRDGERIAQAVFAPLDHQPKVKLAGGLGEHRILAQYKGTVILLQGPDGLYLIDQHVAHERILYERIRRSLMAETVAAQRLLTPPIMELSLAEALGIRELLPELEACGFSITELSGESFAIVSLPVGLPIAEGESLLRALAAEPDSTRQSVRDLRRHLLETLAASLSCRAAVKMHEHLEGGEMERLVSELFEAEQPYACPHGRPIVLQISDLELEKRFGRR